MKSFRSTWIFAVLIGALVAFTLFDYQRAQKAEVKKESDSKVIGMKAEDVRKLEITNRVGTIELVKDGESWKLLSPLEEPADNQVVQTILTALADEKIEQVVAEGGDVNLETYGLLKPVTQLRVDNGAGLSRVVKIGTVKAFDNNLYAQIGAENKVLLVTSNWDVHLSKPVKDFRSKNLYRADGGTTPNIDRIWIRMGQAAKPFELVKTGEDWKIRGGLAGDYPLSSERVTSFVETVKALRAAEVLDEKKTDKGVTEKFGLTKPKWEIRLFSQSNPEPFYGLVIASPEKNPDSKEASEYPAVASDLTPVFKVFKAAGDQVMKGPDEFYDKKRPFAFTSSEVSKVRVEAKELKAEFTKKAGSDSWEVAVGGLQKDFDEARLKEVIEKLSRMEAMRILEPIRKGEVPRALKSASKLVLMNTSGEPVFEFTWGDLIKEKPPGEPEVQYLAARTSKTDHLLGVADFSVRNLGLDQLFKKEDAKDAEAAAKLPSGALPKATAIPPQQGHGGHGHSHDGHQH